MKEAVFTGGDLFHVAGEPNVIMIGRGSVQHHVMVGTEDTWVHPVSIGVLAQPATVAYRPAKSRIVDVDNYQAAAPWPVCQVGDEGKRDLHDLWAPRAQAN